MYDCIRGGFPIKKREKKRRFKTSGLNRTCRTVINNSIIFYTSAFRKNSKSHTVIVGCVVVVRYTPYAGREERLKALNDDVIKLYRTNLLYVCNIFTHLVYRTTGKCRSETHLRLFIWNDTTR